MPKNSTYRIILQIDAKQADAAAARAAANQKKVADAFRDTARVADAAHQKIEVGYYKLAAAGLKFQDQMARAADKAARDADKLADRQTRAADRAADAAARASQKAADAEARRFDKEAQAADKLADRQTRAADKAADRDARATQRKADADARRVDREAQAADKLAERQTRASDKAADAAARAAQKKADAEAKRVEKEARDADRLADRQTKAADKAADQAARSAQKKANQLQAIEDRYLKRDYDATVANEQKKADAAKDAAEKSSEFRKELALAAVALAGGAIVAQFIAVNEQVYKATNLIADYHEALRELAAIKGNTGNTGPELAANLAFRRQTLMSRDESIAFQSAARNTGMASVLTAAEAKDPSRRGIVEGEFTKGLALVGALNTVRGEDAKSAGELAGIIPMTLKGQSNADDVYKEYVRLNKTFQLGGASVPSLIKQYTENASLVTSGVMGKEEASAILSGLSVTKTEKAGMTMESLVKATMGSLDRKRGMGIIGGMSQGAYFKDLGVTKDMGVLDITRMVVDDMEKYRASDMAAGGSGNLENFLTHKGFVNQHERDALRGMHGLITSGMFDSKFLANAVAAPDTDAQKLAVMAAQATDPALVRRQGDLASDAADVSVVGGKDQTFYRLQKLAFEKLKSEGTWGVTGDYKDFGEGWNRINPAAWYGVSQVNSEVVRSMDAERSRAGLGTVNELYSREREKLPWLDRGGYSMADALHSSAVELAGKGVATGTGTLDGILSKATEQVAEQQKLRAAFEAFLQQQQGKGPAAPPNVRPGP